MPEAPRSDPGRARRERARRRELIARARDRAGRNAPWRRRYRIARRAAGGLALRLLAPTALRLLRRSWKIERIGFESYERARAGSGFLGACWHGRMLPALALHTHSGLQVLVSPSDDGSLVTTMLARFGYGVIRGSTNKYGVRAMNAMLAQLRAGGAVVITPDGPRGPRHTMNTGLAWLARGSALPILPVGFACDRAWRLRSWDRFTIPRWRARVIACYGELLRVPAQADEEELERVTALVRVRLLAAERAAFAHLGVEPDW